MNSPAAKEIMREDKATRRVKINIFLNNFLYIYITGKYFRGLFIGKALMEYYSFFFPPVLGICFFNNFSKFLARSSL
ncbi:hypothetical protein A3B48_05755 [Candidatus Gottesmanbacteria bacterium RIFCSPLOWO2_01_FULL_40_10]|nr:MAG: hypothetical protein A3B48_05755 [Candidatus Gottesmanbacteria bacterium RIFCSPLOWO2_01_FULL_40_10]